MTDPSSLPATPLVSPRPPHPPVLLYVENYVHFHPIVQIWVENLSPGTQIYIAKGAVDFKGLLDLHGGSVVGVLTDGHLDGATARDIVQISDQVLGREVPYLVLSADPKSFPLEAFARPPVAVRSKGDHFGQAVSDLLRAIAVPMAPN